MNPQGMSDDALQKVDNPLKVMQPGERVLCEIRRHPFGLFGVYISVAVVFIIAIAIVVAAPMLIKGLSSKNQAVIALGALIVCALTGLFSYVSIVVYKGNRWIVTSDSITEITQISLFRKQTSQLSLANLEDVTVEQDGILESMFGFGVLRAETAGERSKFVFVYCPKPSEYAKEIIAAHEAYIAEKPDEMHTTNQAVANTTSFNQSYGAPQYNPVQNPQPPVAAQQQVPYNPVPQPQQGGGMPVQQYNPVQQPFVTPQQPQQPYSPVDNPIQPQQQAPVEGQWPQQPNG